MGSHAKQKENKSKCRPAITPEMRENQIISMAYDLAEQKIRDGTASSQVLSYFLKLGSLKEEQEKEKLQEEIKLLKAKTKNLESISTSESLYRDAMSAFRKYNGDDYEDENDEDY